MSPLRHSTCSGCTYESILAVWAVAPRLRLPSGQQSKFNLNLLLAWSCIGSSSSSLLANWSSVELNHFEFQRAVTSFEAEVSKKLRLWIWNPAAARALAAMCTHCETAAHASHVISDSLQLEAGLLVVVQQVLLYSFWRCSHRPITTETLLSEAHCNNSTSGWKFFFAMRLQWCLLWTSMK